MRSTSGAHYLALDQLRAVAAFLVFAWHFVPKHEPSLLWLVAPLYQGHTGVALFMTLSGYLFAKLIGRFHLDIASFILNRALRLLPLLIVVLALWWTQEWAWTTTGDFQHLARVKRIASGVLFPTLPNGGWSITVEFHFYLLLPLLLAAVWGTPSSWAALLVAVAAFRAILWLVNGEVQFLAYWTIFGRLDQFLLGMLAWRYSERLRGQHLPAAIAVAVLFAFFTWFTKTGGLLEKAPGLASSSHPIWIIGPMLEGLCYATLIAYYDQTAKPRPTGLSAFVGRIGEYSYSIYLLHFFVVFGAATLVNEHITPMTNYYVGLAWSVVWFLALVPVAYLSYRFIESPFLRLRRPYLKTRTTSQTVSPLWTATK